VMVNVSPDADPTVANPDDANTTEVDPDPEQYETSVPDTVSIAVLVIVKLKGSYL